MCASLSDPVKVLDSSMRRMCSATKMRLLPSLILYNTVMSPGLACGALDVCAKAALLPCQRTHERTKRAWPRCGLHGAGAGEMTGPLVGAAGVAMAADGTRGGSVAVVGTVTMTACDPVLAVGMAAGW